MLSTHQKPQILGCASEAAGPQGLGPSRHGKAAWAWPLAGVLVLSGLAGCGQKGPLYLPGDPTGVQPGASNPAMNNYPALPGDELNNNIYKPAVTR